MSYLDKLKPLDSGNSNSVGNPTPSTGYTSKLQPYEEDKEKSKLRKVGDFFTSSTQKFGKTIAQTIAGGETSKAFESAVNANIDSMNRLMQERLKIKQAGGDTSKLDELIQRQKAQTDSLKAEDFIGDVINKSNKQIIGEAAGTALEALSGGSLSAGKSALLNKSLSTFQKVQQGTKVGGAYGFLSGVSSAMQDNKDTGGILKSSLINTAIGGLTGGALSYAGAKIGEKISPTPEYLGKNLDTRIRKALEGTTGDATQIEEKAFKAKKALQLLTSESEGLSIPDTSASLGSRKTKPFDITKAKPNELVSAVVEMGKKIATNARQTAERASNFGKKVNIDEAIGKVKRAVDDGVIPKATGARLEKQLNNLGNDPLKTHDWIEKVNTKYKNKYERGTISDTALGGVADDVADTLRSQLDLIVDRKGYAEAFGNNQELKRIIVQAAKKANKNVNFGDVSSDAGLDAAISVITGNPAYMARTVGSGIFRGLISSFRNQSPIRNLKKAADLTKKVSSISKLPSSEIKGGSQLALPSPSTGIRSEIRASNPIKVAPKGSNIEFTGKTGIQNKLPSLKDIPNKQGGFIKTGASKVDDITSSIQKAKASGQSFDEWVKGQGDIKSEAKKYKLNPDNIEYHGTGKKFDEFLLGEEGSSGAGTQDLGVFTTKSKDAAKFWAEKSAGVGKDGNVMSVYLDIKNPKIFKTQKALDDFLGDNPEVAINKLKTQGFDSIKYPESGIDKFPFDYWDELASKGVRFKNQLPDEPYMTTQVFDPKNIHIIKDKNSLKNIAENIEIKSKGILGSYPDLKYYKPEDISLLTDDRYIRRVLEHYSKNNKTNPAETVKQVRSQLKAEWDKVGKPNSKTGNILKSPLLTGAGVTGIGAIGAGAFPEKTKEQFAPVQKKVNDSREEFKRRISTVENEALVTRGKDAYKSVGTTGDLGKYQVNPKSLKDWGKAWLGKEVSKSEFLGSPKLQEEFFSEFQNVVDRLKLSPEEAAIAWHSGWGILGKDRQTTTRQERDNEFRQYIKRKMQEDEPRRYLSKFNNVK